MKKSTILPTVVILCAIFWSCGESKLAYLNEGVWRGVFLFHGTESPFNFSVEDDTTGTIKVYLLNGAERFVLDSVRYERDSVIIPIDVFDAILIGKIEDDSLRGYLRKNQSGKQGILFKAAHNQKFRFEVAQTKLSAKKVNASGKWSVILANENGSSRYAVGEFRQTENEVAGTLLTTTGDYRYLSGVVDGDSLKLSAFSGSNPTMLRTEVIDSLHLKGEFLTPSGKTTFLAIKSDTAKLPDPFSLTYLKEGYDKLTFTFPNLNGAPVSLDSEKYRGKVVVVAVMGSWCPNCLDEAAFLSPWYKVNQKRGVEIIGLSFERKDDLSFAKERLEKFIKRFDVNYDILFAGLADKNEASLKLPALNKVLSFPTTIIIDKRGRVRKIHTGFSGPATGSHYQEFIDHFNRDITEALEENIKGI